MTNFVASNKEGLKSKANFVLDSCHDDDDDPGPDFSIDLCNIIVDKSDDLNLGESKRKDYLGFFRKLVQFNENYSEPEYHPMDSDSNEDSKQDMPTIFEKSYLSILENYELVGAESIFNLEYPIYPLIIMNSGYVNPLLKFPFMIIE